ncbi:MAG TPA: serine/threonine-protein kinase [Planctomicrobium sp.]|nr:serine/threonine-protein kinase [Planctomicrobium sp.]
MNEASEGPDQKADSLEQGWLNRVVALDEKLQSAPAAELVAVEMELQPVQQLLVRLHEIHIPSIQTTPRQTTPIGRASSLPERIGRYQIQRLVGVGGCAVVYLANDPYLNRNVALKIPLPPGLLNSESRQRFIQEAQLVAQLDHPHIVSAYEAGEDGPIPFIAYAFCSGPNLSTWIKNSGPMPPEMAAQLLMKLADAVHYSHQRKILHRDIKPANVLLFPTEVPVKDAFPYVPRLSDFGLAKLMEEAICDTASSVLLGTPLYIAPEQLNSNKNAATPTCDVYGLGAVLYETLAGSPPFQGETVIQVFDDVRNGTWVRLRTAAPQVPRDLAMICEKALSLFPEDRYQSANELRDDLNRFLTGERIQARSVGAVTIATRVIESPVRIRDAAAFTIIMNAILVLWILFWLVAIIFDLEIAMSLKMMELLPYSIPIIAVHAGLVVSGIGIAYKKIWGVAIATTLAFLLTLFVFVTLMGWIVPPYPEVYSTNTIKDIVFVLLQLIFGIQTILCISAWRAIVKNS